MDLSQIDYKNLSEKKFKKLLESLQDSYTNDPDFEGLTDEEFDYLVKVYQNKFKKPFAQIGSRPSEGAVKLPYFMPSLNKIKGENASKDLNNWVKNYDGDFLVEDKLDGVSLLYFSGRLYTRGDGEKGEDKTYLLEYLDLPDTDLAVRGELVIHNDIFEEYVESQKDSKNKLKKPRNLVSGLINAKDSLDKDLIKRTSFYAYQIIDSDLTPEIQLETLKKLGFNVPYYKILPSLNIEKLEKILDKRHKKCPYDIDGLVLVKNIHQDISNNDNPKDSIAFKVDTFTETEVINIKWKSKSKDGYLTPVVYIKEVLLQGSDVKKATGYNARFILSNKIGMGSKVIVGLAGSIIPRIFDVLSESDDLIYPEQDYEWDKNEVEFVLKDPDSDPNVRKARIEHFMKTLKIKSIGSEVISKIFDAGFDSIKKIIKMKPDDISEIERMGDKSSKKICDNIQKAITSSSLEDIMTASCVFGEGFGSVTFKKISKVYDIMELGELPEDQIYEKVVDIRDFGEIRAEGFSRNLGKFIKWLNKHKEIKIPIQENKIYDGMLKDKKIAFSGMRAKEDLKSKIEKNGGEVINSVTKKMDFLVIKDSSMRNTGNAQTAEKYGKEIYTLEEFLEKFKL